MKDYLGNELQVSDLICFGFTRAASCRIGEITRFTSKYVYFNIMVITNDGYADCRDRPKEERRHHADVIRYKKGDPPRPKLIEPPF